MAKTLTKTQVSRLLALLHDSYANVCTALVHSNAYELLVATVLSAQANDKLVNTVTPALFARFPNAAALATAQTNELETLIGRVNFFRNKAKNLLAMAKMLVSQHGGEVPHTLEALLELPGVARKTANVVLGTAFGVTSGVVVDTHVMRLSQLLGLTTQSTPEKIERDLMRLLPEHEWIAFSHRLIHHGRSVCIARRPRCDACVLRTVCISAGKAPGYKATTLSRRSTE